MATKQIFYNSRLKFLARKLRKNSTMSEIILWSRLKGRQLGVGFLRQKPIGPYIVDFYAPSIRLVIEVDGCSHDFDDGSDRKRQDYLESIGLRVIRFLDSDVARRIDDVMEQIYSCVSSYKLR